MGVDVRCPACHAHSRVPDEAVGRNIRCKECHHPFCAQPGGANVPAGPRAKKKLLLWIAAGVFVLLVVLLIILRVSGVF
jgi:hypothetical protein